MEGVLITILNYLLDVILSTLYQLFILFGPLLILAFIMNYTSRVNESLSYSVLGKKVYLYGFGWLGTAIHEIGHAIFAVLFGHNITEMKLFTPNSNSLGHVNHSYNQGSIFQTFGNFFIGIGPILFGSILLYLITYFLFKIKVSDTSTFALTSESLTSLNSIKLIGIGIWDSFFVYVKSLFNSPYSVWWKFLILIYFLYSIGSSITLSSADISSAVEGFIVFIIVLAGFNLATLWIGDFTINTFRSLSTYFSGFYFLLILSMMVNLVFIVILLFFRGSKALLGRH